MMIMSKQQLLLYSEVLKRLAELPAKKRKEIQKAAMKKSANSFVKSRIAWAAKQKKRAKKRGQAKFVAVVGPRYPQS